jgi:hypothetical protein
MHPALAQIEADPAWFARHGVVVAKWRYHGGRKLGPYFALIYRQAGRQRAYYLGREGPLVHAVRQRLAELREHAQRDRTYEQFRRQILGSLRVHKARLNLRLGGLGLRLQGFEVRGWRTSDLLRRARTRNRGGTT